MKKTMIAAMLLLAGTATAADAGTNNNPLATGAGFLKQCESTRKGTVEDTECVTYAAGIYSGIAASQKIFAPRLAGNAGEVAKLEAAALEAKYGEVCAPALTPRDLRDKLVKHLKKNARGSSADALMLALQAAYPCHEE